MLNILYIIAIFVLFTPNVFIKTPKQMMFYVIHSICFALFFYLTYELIQPNKEGALLNAYDIYGDKRKIEATNVDLGNVKLEEGTYTLNQQPQIIYTEPHKKPDVIDLPPLLSRNQLEDDLKKLMKHNHKEKERINDVYCAANYGENTTCCNQPASEVPFENQCPKYAPICSGYVAFEKWGKCVSNNDSVPNIQYKEKNKELCFNKHESCSSWKRCCPGGPGSNENTQCGSDDCFVDGKPCVGSWMKENCPRTCGLCNDINKWDGNIMGKYVAEDNVKKGNNNGNYYVTIRKTENERNNTYIWSNDNGIKFILQRISNTNTFRVIGSEYNNWTIAKVYLDSNDHVKYIIGPNNTIFVKQ